MANKDRLIALFKTGAGAKRPLSFREITEALKLSRIEARSFKKTLRSMIKEGILIMTRNGLYGPPVEMSLKTGHLIAHPDGYGFVALDTPGEPDMFIPPKGMAGAMDGDKVVLKVENQKTREGSIIRILERAHKKITGTIDVSKYGVFLKPRNKSMSFDVNIPRGETFGAKKGDSVVVEIIDYPAPRRPATGRVTKILKKPDNPKDEVEAIVEEFNLRTKFPKAVHDEAKSFHAVNDTGKRKDLRNIKTVTIDGERAKDFDDAISIKLAEHGYKLYVHIADVGFYVKWDGQLDVEARSRGTSVYFPDRVIPMLPHELSDDLCSLKPNVERLSITVEVDFDRLGNKMHSAFYPSLIISNERMTYTSVKKIVVDADPAERAKYEHVLKDIELMAELAGILRSVRLRRGSLDFDLPEPEVILDITGRPEAIIRAERNFAHMLIEEFMISANESVAEFLTKSEVPCLYRIHEPPDESKLSDIWKIIRQFLREGHDNIPRGDTLSPDMFSKIIDGVRGTPGEEAVNYIVLRSLKQARYSTENVGHFGLASGCYLHFTSPIRRYPDLVVHRILKELLHKKRLSDNFIKELESILPDIASHSSRTERVSNDAEQTVINAMRVWFMKDKVGEEFKARVVGVNPYGIRVRLEEFYVDGTIHVSNMTDDFYIYNEQGMNLTGRNTKRTYKIGLELDVVVERVDMEERSVLFGFAGVKPAKAIFGNAPGTKRGFQKRQRRR